MNPKSIYEQTELNFSLFLENFQLFSTSYGRFFSSFSFLPFTTGFSGYIQHKPQRNVNSTGTTVPTHSQSHNCLTLLWALSSTFDRFRIMHIRKYHFQSSYLASSGEEIIRTGLLCNILKSGVSEQGVLLSGSAELFLDLRPTCSNSITSTGRDIWKFK